MLNIGDKVTVTVDDSCSFPKGHKGIITDIIGHEDGNVFYEVDDHYEYNKEELELTVDQTMKFSGGSYEPYCEVFGLPKYIPWWDMELSPKPKVEPKLNLESKVEINDDNEFQRYMDEIIRLNEVIADMESELLSLYRELHRINKDS